MAIYQGNKKVGYNIDTTVYSTCPIGTILSYGGSNIPNGYLLCDGSEISKETYKDLYEIIGDTYGNSTDNTKFKLPDLQDKFIQGANNNLGTSKDAGLPNITGEFYQDTNASTTVSGAFIYKSGERLNLANSATATSGAVAFDASRSNSIYGNSDTVQPPSVCLNYIIKALKVSDKYAEEVGALIDDNATDATNKTWSAKKISGSTIPYVLMDVTKDIDLNEYVETGYYTPNKSFSTGWFTHSILNAPTNDWLPAGGFALEVKTFDNTSSSKWCTQVLYSYVGTDNNSAPMYTRTFFYDGSKVMFSPWKRIADIDDSKVSSEETWSSQKINEENKEIYSTDEVKTNKIWIDGKPIYRKVTTQTITTPEGFTPINDFDTSLVDSVISIYGSIKQPSGNITPISFYNKATDGAYVYTSKENNRFMFFARELGVGEVILIVEYTKTTD